MEIALAQYYSSPNPVGHGGDYVQGTIFSRGRGLGSLIRAAIKVAAPLAKKAGRILKPIAQKTGTYMLNKGVEVAADVATDVLSGIPVRDSIKQNAQIAWEDMKYDGVQEIKNLKRRKNPATMVGQFAMNNRVDVAEDISADILSGAPERYADMASENMKYGAAQKIRTIKRRMKPPRKAKKVKHYDDIWE